MYTGAGLFRQRQCLVESEDGIVFHKYAKNPERNGMEKIFLVMKKSGISNMAAGITLLTVGTALGVTLLVNGILLMKEKKNLLF